MSPFSKRTRYRLNPTAYLLLYLFHTLSRPTMTPNSPTPPALSNLKRHHQTNYTTLKSNYQQHYTALTVLEAEHARITSVHEDLIASQAHQLTTYEHQLHTATATITALQHEVTRLKAKLARVAETIGDTTPPPRRTASLLLLQQRNDKALPPRPVSGGSIVEKLEALISDFQGLVSPVQGMYRREEKGLGAIREEEKGAGEEGLMSPRGVVVGGPSARVIGGLPVLSPPVLSPPTLQPFSPPALSVLSPQALPVLSPPALPILSPPSLPVLSPPTLPPFSPPLPITSPPPPPPLSPPPLPILSPPPIPVPTPSPPPRPTSTPPNARFRPTHKSLLSRLRPPKTPDEPDAVIRARVRAEAEKRKAENFNDEDRVVKSTLVHECTLVPREVRRRSGFGWGVGEEEGGRERRRRWMVWRKGV